MKNMGYFCFFFFFFGSPYNDLTSYFKLLWPISFCWSIFFFWSKNSFKLASCWCKLHVFSYLKTLHAW